MTEKDDGFRTSPDGKTQLYFPETSAEWANMIASAADRAPDLRLGDLIEIVHDESGKVYAGIKWDTYRKRIVYAVSSDKVLDEVAKGSTPVMGPP